MKKQTPKEGDTVYYCRFINDDINKFKMESAKLYKIEKSFNGGDLFGYSKGDKLLDKLDFLFISEIEAVQHLINKIKSTQYNEKEDYKKARHEALELLNQLRYNWTERNLQLNRQLQYLEPIKKSVKYNISNNTIEIQALRKRTKLTQAEFADQYGVNVKTLQNWERGKPEVPEMKLELLKMKVRGGK